MEAFDWVNFKDGRACFSGGIRGWDELGHETFCVEVADRELFGEIHKIFTENHNDYNLKIISFGYERRGAVGLPDDEARVILTKDQINSVVEMVCELISIVSKIDDRPIALRQDETSKFLGNVSFKEGWVRSSN